jgi:ribosomal protein S18 acetylase RimI-like enzyme
MNVRYRKFLASDAPAVKTLVREYEKSLGISLDFQGIDGELENLPGAYAEPAGSLFVAETGSDLCGCVALRPLGEGLCEMKRLFVRDRFRSLNIGRTLAEMIVAEAVEKGYLRIRLDTLSSMGPALALYRSLGFREIEAYTYNPIVGAVYMEKELR